MVALMILRRDMVNCLMARHLSGLLGCGAVFVLCSRPFWVAKILSRINIALSKRTDQNPEAQTDNEPQGKRRLTGLKHDQGARLSSHAK